MIIGALLANNSGCINVALTKYTELERKQMIARQ